MDPMLKFGETVVPIHLVRGGRIACMPGMTDLQRIPAHTLQRTDDIRAVTCPMCERIAGVKAETARTG